MSASDRPKPFDQASAYADLADMPEDDRIKKIGEVAMVTKSTAFVTDAGGEMAGKMDRYLEKLFTWFPQLELVERGKGPVPNSEFARVRLRT